MATLDILPLDSYINTSMTKTSSIHKVMPEVDSTIRQTLIDDSTHGALLELDSLISLEETTP